jgi:hypothetical protein
LISFSFGLVRDQSLIGSGVASVRKKLPRCGLKNPESKQVGKLPNRTEKHWIGATGQVVQAAASDDAAAGDIAA